MGIGMTIDDADEVKMALAAVSSTATTQAHETKNDSSTFNTPYKDDPGPVNVTAGSHQKVSAESESRRSRIDQLRKAAELALQEAKEVTLVAEKLSAKFGSNKFEYSPLN